MKKIKSRWFAMLLILSLVFTMGMPMGMIAFGDTTTDLVPEVTNNVPPAPEGVQPVTTSEASPTAEEVGAAMVAAPDNGDYLALTLNTINGEGLGTDTSVNATGLILVPNATYTISGTVRNTYDSFLLDYVHINQVKAACGSTSVSISDLVSDDHYHGFPFSGHWDRSHATENFTITFVAQEGASTASVEATGQREFWKTKQSAVASFAYNGVVPTQAYPVTFGVTGTHGALTAAVGPDAIVTGAQVLSNKTVDFTAAPATGYRVKEWTVNGAVQAGKPLVLNQTITAATAVTVEFEKIANATITITGDDTYSLYVNGTEVEYGPYRSNWSALDTYRVQLEGNYLIAVKVCDVEKVITGLNVSVNFDDPAVEDITGASKWSWSKDEVAGWNSATTLSPLWAPAVPVQHADWSQVPTQWIWSSQADTTIFTPVYFRCTGNVPVPPKYTVGVNSDDNGIAYIGSKTDPLVISKEVQAGGGMVLHAEPKAHYSFDYWTKNSDSSKLWGNPFELSDVQSSATYTAHFVQNFEGALALDPKDDSVNVPKNKVLTMTFNGDVNPFTFYEMGSIDTDKEKKKVKIKPEAQDDFIIFNADGTPFASFNIPDLRPSGVTDSEESKMTINLIPSINPQGSVGSIKGGVVTLDPGTDFVAGASYYVFAPRLEIRNPEMSAMNFFNPPYSDGFAGFGEKTDWNFTIASDSTPGGPSTPGSTQTTTTTERDRADRAVETTNIEPQTVPQGLPAVVAPAPAPAQIVEEAIPLGVPVLPKTGEIPASLFYGIGGILAAAGAFMKRK